jgi:dipeptidyl aminopeptidase/acylaminoacyl peptidase
MKLPFANILTYEELAVNFNGVGQSTRALAHCQSPIFNFSNGKWIVFVKPVPGPGVETGIGNDKAPSELWQVDSQGHHPTLLVRCRNSDENDMSQVIAGFHDLRFSPDGRLVYFTTTAWVTSGALHVVNTTNGREHFICAGGIESFRGNNLVTEESVYKGHGHQIQKFLRSPEGQMLGTVSQPDDR